MTRLAPRKAQPVGPPADEPVRTMSIWVPDWPLVAAGVDPTTPAAVFVANRVVACTASARAAGVRRHMRRREAQSRAPSLLVLDHDPDRDARAFEPVVQAIEALTPRIEITRPGRCAFPTRGPSRYFGGDQALADRALQVVGEVLDAPVAVGVADGPFAAAHAARTGLLRAGRSDPDGSTPPVWVVAPGRSAEYLAPLALAALDRPELAEVLSRLGLHTLGDLAALPVADVLGRFGADGLEAHRLACGLDPRPPATEPPPPDLVVTAEVDPPAEQVAPIAFVARGMAEELHGRLASRGSVCTRIVISAQTEHGERSERVWRHEGALGAGAIADRVRWQMDGWLHANARQRPTAGIVQLWLQPDEIIAADGRQLGFWGADAGAADRAVRAIARVQGLLGADSVLVPEYAGGRDPAEQLRLVPAAAVDVAAERPATRPDWVGAPWPGRLPNPSPATLHPDAVPVDVVDSRGRAVVVDGRCQPTAEPAALRSGGRRRRIVSWAGPWPVDERWWDPDRRSRRVRFQVITDDGAAHLVALEGGRWSIAATYD
jgi:protein ImuB